MQGFLGLIAIVVGALFASIAGLCAGGAGPGGAARIFVGIPLLLGGVLIVFGVIRLLGSVRRKR